MDLHESARDRGSGAIGHNVTFDMTTSLDPFRFVLIAVSGWMNQQQLELINYLRARTEFFASNSAESDYGSTMTSARVVKIFMRRDCSIGVGRQDVLDSGCHVADRAQAEQGRGRAARCSCLGGCVLRDNALGTG